MNSIGRRMTVGVASVVLCATLVPGAGPARGAHPGANGGLTYPVKDGVRVHTVGGASYDLPFGGASDVAWTPDGRFLAFAWNTGEEHGIYVADAAGCTVDQVTTDPIDRAPAFDGVNLFFTRGTATYKLDYSMDADSSPVSGEPQSTGYGTDFAMSILEGRRAHVEPPNAQHPEEYVLLLIDVFLRTEEVEVFRSEHPIRGTEWAPDGSLLAFEATTEDGTVQIFTADVVGDPIEVTQVTDESTNAMMPTFSPEGDALAWYRGTSTRQSGIVQVRDLASGADTFVTQQARFDLDWQSLHDGPWAADVPIETTTTVALDTPSTGPGSHPITVTVTPAPAEGLVDMIVSEDRYRLVLDEDGIAHDVLELGVGTHVISASFGGNCPHRPSADQEVVVVPEGEPEPGFDDISDSPFAEEIEWLVAEGITTGCAPDLFCPRGLVTRAQMASFIARALELPAATDDHFADDAGTHEEDINRLFEAGITNGCAADRFCPDRTLSRMEMASLLARALELPAATMDWFDDDDGRTHEDNINRLAEAGITGGCGVRRFCPTRSVTREEMAAFLYRALS